MKKYILLICSVFILAGCNANKPQPEKQPEVVQEEEAITPVVEEVVVEEKEVVKPKVKIFPGTYYRMITKSIEVFSYNGNLKNISQINEKNLKNPFYVKGNLIKVEKIYESTIGERYGKIAGKNLLVSMDDLTTYTKK